MILDTQGTHHIAHMDSGSQMKCPRVHTERDLGGETSIVAKFRNQRVCWFENVGRTMATGSMKPQLQAAALAIFSASAASLCV